MSKSIDSDKIVGYLVACQTLAISFDEPSHARNLLAESGFNRKELLLAQKKTGYENRVMNQLIREATE